MSVEALVTGFLRIAHADLDAARLLLAHGNRNAVYHCEQAAEKIIRAVLTSEGIHAGVGHHLQGMVDRVPDENPVKPALRGIEFLTAYATAFRYPTTAGKVLRPPSQQDVEQAMARVEAVLGDVSRRFDLEWADPNALVRRRGPLR